ncbi:MAG TPA: hypothetical protein PKE55_03970 [Kiritimatiellia bacterium]|nr:hypothetical protein [Kiritimatiellia bacterium]
MPPLFILDAIGPFFRELPPGRINWSKIPFTHLERDGRLDRERFARIREDFRTLCANARDFGFNALSLDDLAHLVDHPAYPPDLSVRIHDYQEEYTRLFEIAEEYGLLVFLTTDLMFFNPTLVRDLGTDSSRILSFLTHALETLFTRFPSICGIITRIGETDGLDVEGDFRSQLVIRTARTARRYLNHLLPVFEKHNRTWIFRTWSVGAYPIGDLIWNRDTLQEIFSGIESPRLILSIKYGESDFFRYLPINKQFFRGNQPKLIELQARREYEGAGEFPSFIGPDYQAYRDAIRDLPTFAGAMVWCQTGGWLKFRRLTFLEPEGLWNEINTWVCIRIFRDGLSSDEAVEQWRRRYARHLNHDKLLRFLTLSSDVVRRLLYVESFARQKVYFRRLRLPPQLSVFWDRILINHGMRQVLRAFTDDGDTMIAQANRALADLDIMLELAEDLSLPTADIAFMRDTFHILALARHYYFRDFSPAIVEQLEAARSAYRERYPLAYSIHLDFQPARITSKRLRRYFQVLFRRGRDYRLVDRIFTIWMLGKIYPLLLRFGGRVLPEFSRKQAMGIDTLFK